MNTGNERDVAPPGAADAAGRIQSFALYFKRYMSVSAIVAAAVPIPVAAFRLIPAYAAQAGFLGVYTSLATFLVLAFVFYSRHWIAHRMFVKGERGSYRTRPIVAWLPLFLIILSLGAIFTYHSELDASVRASAQALVSVGITESASQILVRTDAPDIPGATTLIASYLGIFIFAEAAFAVMALREYLQDLMGVSEQELLGGR